MCNRGLATECVFLLVQGPIILQTPFGTTFIINNLREKSLLRFPENSVFIAQFMVWFCNCNTSFHLPSCSSKVFGRRSTWGSSVVVPDWTLGWLGYSCTALKSAIVLKFGQKCNCNLQVFPFIELKRINCNSRKSCGMRFKRIAFALVCFFAVKNYIFFWLLVKNIISSSPPNHTSQFSPKVKVTKKSVSTTLLMMMISWW